MPAGGLGLCETEQRRPVIIVCHKLTSEREESWKTLIGLSMKCIAY